MRTLAIALVLLCSCAAFGQSLHETTSWMHNFVEANGFWRGTDGSLEGNTLDFVECQVKDMERTTVGHPSLGGMTYSLGDLDPNSIGIWGGPIATVHFDTTNEQNKIKWLKPDGTPEWNADLSSWVVNFGDENDAKRFARAFKHAVILCGGKPSTF
jgi:hypothetical protein